MTRPMLLSLVLMVGCKGCEERRAARAMDELEAALQVDTLTVFAEQVEREDGGTEAWGQQRNTVYVTAPSGWTLTLNQTAPPWILTDCPDDVPLVAYSPLTSDNSLTIPSDKREAVGAYAGGCDADGDDLRGTYDAGYTLDIEATNADGDSYALTLPVPVELTIE